MSAKARETYITVGGWPAQVIWVSEFTHICYAIHKPNTKEESAPIAHNKYDGQAAPLLTVNQPPRYDKQLPADIILPLE
jgi:hypothetical protein